LRGERRARQQAVELEALLAALARGRQSLADSFELRRTALMMKTPYYTTAAGALAAAQAIVATVTDTLEVRPLQSYA